MYGNHRQGTEFPAVNIQRIPFLNPGLTTSRLFSSVLVCQKGAAVPGNMTPDGAGPRRG